MLPGTLDLGDGIDELASTMGIFHQKAMVSRGRHCSEILFGGVADDIDRECVRDRQLCLLVEVIETSNGKYSDWIFRQARRGDKDFPKFRVNAVCLVFVRKLEEVIHQPRVFNDRGTDQIDESQEDFEDVGRFGDVEYIESGLLRSVARWLGGRECGSEGDRGARRATSGSGPSNK